VRLVCMSELHVLADSMTYRKRSPIWWSLVLGAWLNFNAFTVDWNENSLNNLSLAMKTARAKFKPT